MPKFTSRAGDMTVCLHDEAGKRLGKVQFTGGQWSTEDAALAEAMQRVAAQDAGRRIVPVEPPPAAPDPLPEPEPVAPVAPAPTPTAATRHSGHSEGKKHHA